MMGAKTPECPHKSPNLTTEASCLRIQTPELVKEKLRLVL
jgi:hypothetical protein